MTTTPAHVNHPQSSLLKQLTTWLNNQDHATLPQMLSEADVARLWVLMTKIYGHKWVTNFGQSDKDHVWLAGLRGLTPEMIKRGLSECVNQFKSWPPTLPEFKALCLEIPDKQVAIENAIFAARDKRTLIGNKIYQLVGDWDMKTLNMRDLRTRCNEVYDRAVNECVMDTLKARYQRLLEAKP